MTVKFQWVTNKAGRFNPPGPPVLLRKPRCPSTLAHGGFRLACLRQQDVQQPQHGGQIEQVDQVAGVWFGLRFPAAHDAGVDLQASGQLPSGQSGGLLKAFEPQGEFPGKTPLASRGRPAPAGVPSPLLPARPGPEVWRQQHVTGSGNLTGPRRHHPHLAGGGDRSAPPLPCPLLRQVKAAGRLPCQLDDGPEVSPRRRLSIAPLRPR